MDGHSMPSFTQSALEQPVQLSSEETTRPHPQSTEPNPELSMRTTLLSFLNLHPQRSKRSYSGQMTHAKLSQDIPKLIGESGMRRGILSAPKTLKHSGGGLLRITWD